MGTITVNIDDETEQLFRNAVKKEYGTGKGVLGRAIAESMKNWQEEKEQNKIRERALAILRKGFDFGGYKFKRDDAYADRMEKLEKCFNH